MATPKSAERPFTIRESYLPEMSLHVVLTLQDTADEQRTWTGCGDSWCTGGCGLPLLRVHCPEDPTLHLRVFGSQVARGMVVQETRRAWKGVQLLLPEDVSTYLRRRIWP